MDKIKADAIDSKILAHEDLTEEETKELKEEADPECKDCDGAGIFYGNVCICGCIFIMDF